MAKVSEVINEVITRFVVDDQTAQPTEAAGARIDALQDKSDALAESGKRIGESYQEGFEAAGSAANRTVESVVSGTGKLETSARRLKDSVDQITHDVQQGAGNTEKALSGISEAAEDTATAADKINTSFKDSLNDATKSAEDLVTVITRSATSADKTWQNTAARTGDSISKIQRQIRLAQDEYDRLGARGVEAIGSGGTNPEDVTRVLDAQREKIDALVQQEAKLRLAQTATAETFTKMGEDGSSASAVLEKLSAAEMAEVISLRELRSAFESNLLSLNGYRKGVQDITADYAAMQRASDGALSSIASSYQSNLNSNLGISLPSNDLSASRLEDVTGAFADADAIRAKIVPLAAAERDYAKAVTEADSALATGIINQQEYDAYVGKATEGLNRQKAAFGGNAAAVKLTSFEMGILVDETHKFFDQVLAGGSPLQAAFYQVPNMVQVMGGLDGALTRVVGALSGPAGLVVAAGAAGAAILGMGKYAESEQENLAQLSTHLRATRTDYTDMAEAAEKAARSLHQSDSDLSLSDSRTAVQTIVSVPTVNSSQIERYMTDARNLAAVMGETVPEAAKTMASALQDPAKAAEEFSQQGLPGFNAGLVLSVQHMQQMGDRAGALDTVLKRMEQTTKGAEEQALTPFQTALKNLKDETGGVGDAVSYSFQHMGDGIVSMATEGINALTDLIGLVEQVPEKVENAASGIWDTVKEGAAWLESGAASGIAATANFTGATNLAHIVAQSDTADPTFSMPSNTNATGSYSAAKLSPTTASVDAQTAAVTKNTAAWEADRKEIDAHIGSDGSLSGQIADHQRNIEGLTSSIAKLKALGVEHYDSGNVESYNAAMKNLTGQLQAEEVALGGLRGPFAELLEQQDRATQSAAALTGYNKAMVDAAQQADDAARQLSGGLASASEKALVQAAAARTLAAEYTTSTSVMQRNTSLQGLIAEAWTQGGVAAEHATNYVQAYTDALDHYQEGSSAFAEAVAKRTKALDDQYSVTQKIQMAQQTDANNHQVQLLDAETATIGQNADARTKLINRMRVEQDQLQKGNSLEDESVQKLLASTDALSDATAEYQHAQQVMDDFTGSISDMADQLSDGVVQGFMQGTSSGMSFKSMLQGVEASVASVIARFALINPLLNSIDGGTRTTLADLGNLFGKVGAGSSSSSASNILSGYGEGNDITSSGWAYSPWEALNVKNQISNPAGSAAKSGGMFSGLGNLFSGKAADGSGIFSSVGSAVSSIGSYMGMAGAAFGIGDMAYNLLSQLFAKRKKDYQYVSVGSDGMLDISGHVYKDIHGNDNVASGLQSDLDNINNVFGYTGVSATNTDTIGKVGWSKKGKKSKTYSLTDLLPDLDLTSSDATMQQELKQLMPTSFDSVGTFTQDLESLKTLADALDSMKVSVSKFDDSTHVTVDHFNGYTGDMAKALSTLDGKTLSTDDLQSQFQAIEEFVGTTMPGLLNVTATGSESLMQQVDDLKAKYQDAAKTAASYGLDAQALLDKGNAIAQQMIDAEQRTLDQADQSVQARDMAATGNQEGADLLNQQVSAAQEIQKLQDNWRGFLGDNFADNVTYQQQLADLEKTQADERLHIQKEYDQKSVEAAQKAAEQRNEAWSSIQSMQTSWQAAGMTANGNQEGADLLNFDASASQQKSQLDTLAKTYWGDNYATQKQYQDMLLDLDRSLGAQRVAIEQEYAQKVSDAWSSIQSMQTSWQAADMTANGNQEGADLLNFDASASQQKSQLDALAKTYWGDNYATQKQYQDMVLEMDKSLSDQRLKIQSQYAQEAAEQQEEAAEQQQQYVDQAQQSIASIFSSLTTYVNGLDTSDASPLSAEDQYGVANDNFQTDYKAAMGGDYDALSRMQTDAQTLLSTGKTYDGSGTDYASLFSTVTTDLGNLVNANLSKMQQTLITQEKSSTSDTKSLSDTVATLAKQVAELVASNQKVASTLKMNTLVTAQAGKAAAA